KGLAWRESAEDSQGPDAGLENLATKSSADIRSSKTQQAGPIHSLAASCRCGCIGTSVPQTEAEGKCRNRRGNSDQLWRESSDQAEESLRTGTHRALPATSGTPGLHPQIRR